MKDLTITDNKKYSDNIRMIEVLSIIFVVLIHTYNIEVYHLGKNDFTFYFEDFMNFFTSIAVPFFFIKSSLFLYKKGPAIKEVVINKTKQLIIPYLFFNIVYMIMFTILNKLGFTESGLTTFNFKDIINGIFFYKYSYAFWFLYSLILLTLLYIIFDLI